MEAAADHAPPQGGRGVQIGHRSPGRARLNRRASGNPPALRVCIAPLISQMRDDCIPGKQNGFFGSFVIVIGSIGFVPPGGGPGNRPVQVVDHDEAAGSEQHRPQQAKAGEIPCVPAVEIAEIELRAGILLQHFRHLPSIGAVGEDRCDTVCQPDSGECGVDVGVVLSCLPAVDCGQVPVTAPVFQCGAHIGGALAAAEADFQKTFRAVFQDHVPHDAAGRSIHEFYRAELFSNTVELVHIFASPEQIFECSP